MGKENDVMLEFLRDDRRFADLFNGGLFGGEGVVNAAELEEAGENYTEFRTETARSTENTAKEKTLAGLPSVPKDKSTAPRSRDIKKRLKSGEELRILAIEEQSLIDYTMPWRCMNYDSLEYERQIRALRQKNQLEGRFADKHEKLCRFRKQNRLTPVYTICLYHGSERWDGPRCLRDMMQFGSDESRSLWESQFSDYGMRLICVNELEDTDQFTTGLRELFAIMAYRNDKRGMNQFLEEHKEYQQLDEETAGVIGAMMGVRNFMDNKDQYQEEGKYNMCQAIRELWEDGWNDGLNEGIERGIERGISQGVTRGVSLSATIFRAVQSGLSDNQRIALQCGCSPEEVQQVRTVFEI